MTALTFPVGFKRRQHRKISSVPDMLFHLFFLGNVDGLELDLKRRKKKKKKGLLNSVRMASVVFLVLGRMDGLARCL